MTLLESIQSDERGYTGYTEEGEEIRIDSVPVPKAIGVFTKQNLGRAMLGLRRKARYDESKLYFIQEIDEVLEQSDNPSVFAIGYTVFEA